MVVTIASNQDYDEMLVFMLNKLVETQEDIRSFARVVLSLVILTVESTFFPFLARLLQYVQ